MNAFGAKGGRRRRRGGGGGVAAPKRSPTRQPSAAARRRRSSAPPVVGPSISHATCGAFKNGIDSDGVDGAVFLTLRHPAIQVEYVRHEEPVLNTTFWRGVGPTHNSS